MNLSLQDIAAILYSGAGSQRAMAAHLGISHQKVGRILRTGQPGGYGTESRVLRDPSLIRTFALALRRHIANAAALAQRDGLPFYPALPIFARRMIMQDGTPGDRVEAPHLHWVSDALRDAWLRKMHGSGKFYSVSMGSIVNLVVYSKAADKRFYPPRGKPLRTQSQLVYQAQIKNQIKQQTVQGMIQTTYTAFAKNKNGIPVQYLLDELNDKLKERHEPATGEPGTFLAARALFQIDTRNGKDKPYRDAHPYKPAQRAPKRRKAK